MNNYILQFKNISINRNGVYLLESIDLKLQALSLNIIKGKSGSGKTSFLRLINRLDEPTEGIIYFNDLSINTYSIVELRTSISMVFQIPITFDGTVRDNLLIQSNLGLYQQPSFEHLCYILDLCSLSRDYLERTASDLSVGEKQRLNIARSIIHKPKLLLLDEPTSALDNDNSQNIIDTIKMLNKDLGITILIATHKLHESDSLQADIYELKDRTIHIAK